MIKKLLLVLLAFWLIFIAYFSSFTNENQAEAAFNCSMTHNDVNSDATSVTLDITAKDLAGDYNVIMKVPGDANWYTIIDAGNSFKPAVFNVTDGKIHIEKLTAGRQINIAPSDQLAAGPYQFNVINKGATTQEKDRLCNTMGFTVPQSSGNSSIHCSITLTSDSPDGKVYPTSAITMQVAFDQSAGLSESSEQSVKVYPPGGGTPIHDWGFQTGCGLTNSCNGFITQELEHGIFLTQKTEKGGFQPYQSGKGYKVVVQSDRNLCSKTFDSDNKDNGGGTISGTCKYCPIGTYQGGDGDSIVCKSDGTTVVPFYTCDKTPDNPTCDPVYGCSSTYSATQTKEETRTLEQVCPPSPDGKSNIENGTCKSIPSGIGDIQTSVGGFIKSILGMFLGIIGGIAIIIIIISGYRLMVSQGNPEKIQAAKEQLTAAIVGLLFVIFSIVILQVIGYDILRLPGFNP